MGDDRRPTQLAHLIKPYQPPPTNLTRDGVLRRHTGRFEEGLTAAAEGIAIAAETGQGLSEVKLLRLKGELLWALDSSNAAAGDRSFREAIEVSRRQSTRLFELEATTSLARLLRDTGRRAEARTMLADIYNQFTEGFDTADLKDAKALLDELNE